MSSNSRAVFLLSIAIVLGILPECVIGQGPQIFNMYKDYSHSAIRPSRYAKHSVRHDVSEYLSSRQRMMAVQRTANTNTDNAFDNSMKVNSFGMKNNLRGSTNGNVMRRQLSASEGDDPDYDDDTYYNEFSPYYDNDDATEDYYYSAADDYYGDFGNGNADDEERNLMSAKNKKGTASSEYYDGNGYYDVSYQTFIAEHSNDADDDEVRKRLQAGEATGDRVTDSYYSDMDDDFLIYHNDDDEILVRKHASSHTVDEDVVSKMHNLRGIPSTSSSSSASNTHLPLTEHAASLLAAVHSALVHSIAKI